MAFVIVNKNCNLIKCLKSNRVWDLVVTAVNNSKEDAEGLSILFCINDVIVAFLYYNTFYLNPSKSCIKNRQCQLQIGG